MIIGIALGAAFFWFVLRPATNRWLKRHNID
jgi:hypothetical protein